MWRRGAWLLAGALVASLTVAPQLASAAVKHAVPQKVSPVPGGGVAVKPLPVDGAKPFAGAIAVNWPAATTTELKMGQARTARAGVVSVAGTGSVKVQVLDQAESAKAGIAGILVKLVRVDKADRTGSTDEAADPVDLSVDYTGFKDAYGGDWASRLHVTRMGSSDALPQRNDVTTGRITAQVAPDANAVFAVAAEPEGATGTYKATSLSQTGQWNVSAQTGSFSWSYPMRVPPAPSDLVPQVGLGYDSGSVDGRVPTANNQTSWIGEGWQLGSGFIERRYKGCLDDKKDGNQNNVDTGDLCWFNDNATLSMGGHNGPLVRVGTSAEWRLRNDDGSKLELLTGTDNGDNNGEYWKLTTTDGTQYFFGRNKIPGRADTNSAWTVPVVGNHANEPCNTTTYDASFCDQAYRWNLDYVVDTNGNTMIYTYEKETNKYARNLGKSAAPYTRGGNLLRIDYGTRAGDGAAAPAQVAFLLADRCVPGKDCSKHVKDSWPDVPWDQQCDGTSCGDKKSPTFFSTKRLASVTTLVNGKPVERWTMNQTYPAPGDETDPALWLESIGHEGLVGTPVTASPVRFYIDPDAKGNRLNTVGDGLPKGNKNRIHHIVTDSGGEIDVNYRPRECTATALPPVDTNAKLCFPVRWSPDRVKPIDDWFHKFVVDSVAQVDRTGAAPTQFTSYDYEGGGAWAYDDDPLVEEKYRSWTQWRGFGSVRTRQGDPKNPDDPTETTSRAFYFRGMNGDKLKAGGTKSVQVAGRADDPPLAGFLREAIKYDKLDGNELSATVTDPKIMDPTATQGAVKAQMVKPEVTYTRTTLADGGQRKTETHTTYDEYGFPTQVNDLGDSATADDDKCTTTTYARNLSAWQLSLPRTAVTVGVKCGGTPVFPRDAISDTKMYYDDNGLDDQPAAGNPTKVETRTSYSGSQQFVPTTRSTYDKYGRVVKALDANDNPTTTTYLPDTGLPTSTTTTNALNHKTVTTLEPAWNLPTRVEGPNKERTDTQYDAFGRVTQVWAPGRSRDGGLGASVKFTYSITPDKAPSIRTEQLKANNNYVTSYALFDSFLRERQTQEPSPQGGRKLTDILYDTRGLVERRNSAYFNDQSGPTDALFAPIDAQIPNQTVSRYDGAGRVVEETYEKNNTPQWTTKTSYGGDNVLVTPPAGGTPTRTYTDAAGQQTELREYPTADTLGPYNSTKRGYTKAGKLASITDAIGNVWTTTYDLAGNATQTTDPDKGTTTMTYDAVGNLLTSKDARGKTLVTLYDKLNRKYETHEDSATGPMVGTWSYDKIKAGQLDATTRFVGTDKYVKRTNVFDDADRPTEVELVIPQLAGTKLPTSFKTTTAYLADGSTGSVTLPKLGALDPETVVYGYNQWGLPTSITGASTYVEDSTYTALGELTQEQLGTEAKRVWLTNNFEEGTRRLQQSLTEREDAVSEVDRVNYRYDPIGNIKQVNTTSSGADRQCYGYDGLRRLTEAWTSTKECDAAGAAVGGVAPYWKSYEYDAVGRRKSQTLHGLNGTPDARTTTTFPVVGELHPHAPKSVSTSGSVRMAAAGDYTYDETGNTKAKPGGQSYDWDAEGHLAAATVNGSTTSYVNTLDNERLVANSPGSTTLYLASGELKLDKASGNVTATRYYLFANQTVAARTSKTAVSYLISDGQGTANLTVDAASLQPAKRRFDPFGAPRDPAPAVWPGDRGFVGGTGDPTTGLTRLGVRDYDSATGTFVTVDPEMPSGTPQQLNAYSYAVNNPTTFTDPTGNRPEDVPGYCVVWRGDCGFDPVMDVAVPSGQYTPEQVKRVAHAARVGYAQHPWKLKGWYTPIYWNKKARKAYPVGLSPYDVFDRENWNDPLVKREMQKLEDCHAWGPGTLPGTHVGCGDYEGMAGREYGGENQWATKRRKREEEANGASSFSVCVGVSGFTYGAEACIAVDGNGVGWSAGWKRTYGPGGIVPGASVGIKGSESDINGLSGNDTGGSLAMPPFPVDMSVSRSEPSKQLSVGFGVGTPNFNGPNYEESHSSSGYWWGGK